MKASNALRKVQKVLGKEMRETRKGNVNGKTYYIDYNDKYGLSFMVHLESQEIFSITVENKKDPDDYASDYYSSIFFDNISQALRFLQSM